MPTFLLGFWMNWRQKRIAFEIFRPLKTLLNIYGMKDVERKDSFGKTPIHYAQTEGHFSTARILELRLSESNCAAKRFKSQWRKKYICVSTELSEYIFSKNITISFIPHFFPIFEPEFWNYACVRVIVLLKSSNLNELWRKKNICVSKQIYQNIFFKRIIILFIQQKKFIVTFNNIFLMSSWWGDCKNMQEI